MTHTAYLLRLLKMAEDERNDELQARHCAEDEHLLSAQLPQPPTYTEIAIPAAFEPPPSYVSCMKTAFYLVFKYNY